MSFVSVYSGPTIDVYSDVNFAWPIQTHTLSPNVMFWKALSGRQKSKLANEVKILPTTSTYVKSELRLVAKATEGIVDSIWGISSSKYHQLAQNIIVDLALSERTSSKAIVRFANLIHFYRSDKCMYKWTYLFSTIAAPRPSR